MLVLHSCYTCMFVRLGINETGKNTISMKNICMTQTGEKNRICVRTGSIWMFSILGSVTAVIFNNPVYNELTRLHNVGFHFPVWNLSDTARHILCWRRKMNSSQAVIILLHTQVCMHACMHVHTHTHMHACFHTRSHSQSHTHARAHTHTHTHTSFSLSLVTIICTRPIDTVLRQSFINSIQSLTLCNSNPKP